MSMTCNRRDVTLGLVASLTLPGLALGSEVQSGKTGYSIQTAVAAERLRELQTRRGVPGVLAQRVWQGKSGLLIVEEKAAGGAWIKLEI
ncbi:hypothetical protein TRP8649_01168 [Pelagimonas phthalicica]|uniref:Uncharacterized protein n=1 Tax=Pelagimonas phthalicica TaxID=1037362 RepID=A0A238JB33_9RHOB|nr:hypothetical protein [Pelagimonas phthalicica]TDS94407.1 hypothetical protein CLV87_0904 [Pelagimonas phthalicica]SMX27066.1 hypothetical protein TRP8649_01168 [Pelagimonas phthalicica]